MVPLLSPFLANAQERTVDKPVISGEFNYQKKKIPKEVMFWTFPKNNFWDRSVDYSVKIGLQNHFKFQFEGIKQPMLYALKLIDAVDGKKKVLSLGDFYVESNDNVQVKIFDREIRYNYNGKKDSLVFSGEGAEKYNLIEALTKDKFLYVKALGAYPKQNITSLSGIDSCIKYLVDKTIYFSERKKNLIDNYPGVSPIMKKIINYQYGHYDTLLGGRIIYVYNLYDAQPAFQKRIKEYYLSIFGEPEQPEVEALLSPSYYQSIQALLKRTEFMKSDDGSVSLEEHYNLLKTTYSGLIRERMLMELFMGGYGTYELANIATSYDAVLLDAAKYLVSTEGRRIVALKTTFKKGTPLFNADFMGLDGKSFNTESLKGKVFLFDMWGLGCSVCAAFHDRFEKESWPDLKKHTNFVMLSVFSGKTMDSWKKGMDSKLYTSPDYLNLSNIPHGSRDHPFMKHYNIIGAPFIMLVDKQGKIVTKISPNMPSKELQMLIETELNKP
ncbi:TlpA family protein disulfide reductase [Pedobacter psychroterrae]|uniref:Thioredoxin domain-containing protein n=1 Tax=Pedobacter psychroterrae TaxID=2530453 RepID=A0A4R0NQ89_9SPHI|nr:thioredoxin-like domain-containing protein [Pedobacter psychroterrae]TCD01234.1 hypothetical protein EZ437_10785 [Pedobacter psychroterrae]